MAAPETGAARYLLRQRLWVVGDDYWIEDDAGVRLFRVDAKVHRLRNTVDVEDVEGSRVCRVQSKLLHVHSTLVVEGGDGRPLATVHDGPTSVSGHTVAVELPDGAGLDVHGDIDDHTYELLVAGRTVAEVSTRWFVGPDTFGMEIAEDIDVALALGVAVALDILARRQGRPVPTPA